jgi:hypothetical protein
VKSLSDLVAPACLASLGQLLSWVRADQATLQAWSVSTGKAPLGRREAGRGASPTQVQVFSAMPPMEIPGIRSFDDSALLPTRDCSLTRYHYSSVSRFDGFLQYQDWEDNRYRGFRSMRLKNKTAPRHPDWVSGEAD